MKSRKLFLDKPLIGFQIGQEFSYVVPDESIPDLKEPMYIAVSDFSEYPFNISEPNVEVFLHAGIIREELPKIWGDKDMIDFAELYVYDADTVTCEKLLTEFKKSKGIE